MQIHHATKKRAEQLGFQLASEDDSATAFWPQRNQRVFGLNPKEALLQMEALKAMIDHAENNDMTATWRTAPGDRRVGWLVLDGAEILEIVPATPHELRENNTTDGELDLSPDGTLEDIDGAGVEPEDGPKVDETRIGGVPKDGATAYTEKFVSGDMPFDEGSDEAEAWYVAWDEAADAAPDEEETKVGGNVVREKYRQIYREKGHPDNCGDWFAQLMENLVSSGKAFDLELFVHIAEFNSVDTKKYKQEKPSDRGRLRMSAGNVLRRKVWLNGGKLAMPETVHGGEVYQAPADWMAEQSTKYKAAKA